MVFEKINLERLEGGSRLDQTVTTDNAAKLFFFNTK